MPRISPLSLTLVATSLHMASAAHAQAERAPSATAPAGAAPAGTVESPTVFEDEPIGLPAEAPAEASSSPSAEPTTLDELTISSQRARVEINLFGAMRAALSTDEPFTDFSLAPLGVMFSGRMSPALSAVAEMVLETNDQGEAIVDLERVVLRWTRPIANGQLALGAGRTHTEIGYWNTAFHHGTWLQPSIERPRTLRFEDDGGLLPVHLVGAWAEVRRDMSKGAWRAVVGIGNGRGDNVDDLRVASDVDAFKSIVVHGTLIDVVAPGVHVGGSLLVDRLRALDAEARPALPDTAMMEIIANAFVAKRGDPWTVLSELYAIVHTLPGRDTKSFEGFALAGYSVGSMTPYGMLEGRISYGGADPFFVPDPASFPAVEDFVAFNAGVRFELSTWCSLKAEGEIARQGGSTTAEATVDWAFGL